MAKAEMVVHVDARRAQRRLAALEDRHDMLLEDVDRLEGRLLDIQEKLAELPTPPLPPGDHGPAPTLPDGHKWVWYSVAGRQHAKIVPLTAGEVEEVMGTVDGALS